MLPQNNPPDSDSPSLTFSYVGQPAGSEVPASPPSLSDEEDELCETDEQDLEEAADDLDELENWKSVLRRDFEAWLETVDSIPEPECEQDTPETPDLAMFYAQWAAANAEARKANRRTAEAFSQWGDVLGKFEGDLRQMREQLQRFNEAAPSRDTLSRAHCLSLVDLHDRMQRMARAFASPPAVSWWGGGKDWRSAWENQQSALDILISHVDTWLKKEGIVRIETSGQTFDPATMTAVEACPDPSRPHHSVLEELCTGYRHRGELLRPAQVKVTLNKNTTPTLS